MKSRRYSLWRCVKGVLTLWLPSMIKSQSLVIATGPHSTAIRKWLEKEIERWGPYSPSAWATQPPSAHRHCLHFWLLETYKSLLYMRNWYGFCSIIPDFRAELHQVTAKPPKETTKMKSCWLSATAWSPSPASHGDGARSHGYKANGERWLWKHLGKLIEPQKKKMLDQFKILLWLAYSKTNSHFMTSFILKRPATYKTQYFVSFPIKPKATYRGQSIFLFSTQQLSEFLLHVKDFKGCRFLPKGPMAPLLGKLTI